MLSRYGGAIAMNLMVFGQFDFSETLDRLCASGIIIMWAIFGKDLAILNPKYYYYRMRI